MYEDMRGGGGGGGGRLQVTGTSDWLAAILPRDVRVIISRYEGIHLC